MKETATPSAGQSTESAVNSTYAAARRDEAYQLSACPACEETRGESVLEEICEGVNVRVVVCAGCGLGYSNPRPSEAYKLQRYQEWATQARPWQAEAHYDHRQQLRHFALYRRVMQLIQTRRPRGRILDVGCGGGLFLIFAGVFASEHNAGINSDYEVEGAGFDPREVELARAVSGAPVHTVSELAGLPDHRFDAITLLNVLEHVNRPVELLRELRRLLRPDGSLVVVVPNNVVAFARPRLSFLGGLQSLASNEHINHFRPGSLRGLLGRCGFARCRILPDILEGGYGSMMPLPAQQWGKYGVYRVLDALSFRRCYLYANIVAVAE